MYDHKSARQPRFASRVLRRLRNIRAKVREAGFPLGVKHVSGPKQPSATANQLVLVCLVRDGAAYIDEFLSHYRALGVKHMVFLDNGSTDGTPERLAGETDVTIFQTYLPYKVYKDVMKRWLVQNYGRANWVLCVDVDELFDYPYRDRLPLGEFLGYLNQQGANAVAAQILDLFPRGAVDAETPGPWRETHSYYSLKDLERQPYRAVYEGRNEAPDIGLEVFFGGVRSSKFGVRALLTKHPLQFPGRGVVLEHAHHVSAARLADVSAVLLHYKYVGDFYSYARTIAAEESFSMGSREYKRYVATLEENTALSLYDEHAHTYDGPERLLTEGFLVAGEHFLRRVDATRAIDAK